MVLAGCAGPVAQLPAAPVALASDGLRIGAQEISFNRHQPGAVKAMRSLLGEPAGRGICGSVEWIRWPGRLTTYFAAQNFRGWSVDEGAIWPLAGETVGGTAGLTCADQKS